MEAFRVKDLESYLSGLNRIFDIIRITDPINKRVFHQEGKEIGLHGVSCYDIWNREEFCANCISINAIKQKTTTTKIEYNSDGIFLVMATPIIFGEDEYIVEMIKDISRIEEFAGVEGKGIEFAKEVISELNEKLIRDELTGVYNRRYINRKLPRDIQDAARKKEEISVIMLDIDGFKEINDIYGHIAGDLVLKELAEIINSNIRKDYDWVARFGGDEFLIMLKNSNEKIVNKVVGEIQNAFKDNDLRFDNYAINLTVSFGALTVEPGTMNTHEILLAVDNNLNKAKRDGKDRLISS